MHPPKAEALHNQYHEKIGKVIGQVAKGETPQQAEAKARGNLKAEFNRTFYGHQPKSAWEQTLRDEGRNTAQINSFYRKEALQYHAPMQATRGARSLASNEGPSPAFNEPPQLRATHGSMLIGDTGTEREHEPLLATPP